MQRPPTIETNRLRLRPFKLDDAPQVQVLAGAAEIAKTTLNIPHPYEEGMAERWIATHDSLFLKGQGLTLAIIHLHSEALLGAIGLGISAAHRRAELGYWIGVPYWGQGYCTEAAEAIVRHGFETLGLNKISSRHMTSNPSSGRIMQKAGMIREGVLRQEIQKDGTFHDLVVYGLLAEQYLPEAERVRPSTPEPKPGNE